MQKILSVHTSRVRLIAAAVYAIVTSAVLCLISVNYKVSVYQYGFLISEILFSTLMIICAFKVEDKRAKIIFNFTLYVALSMLVATTFDLTNGMYNKASEMGFSFSLLRFSISTLFCLLIYLITVSLLGRSRIAAIVCSVFLCACAFLSYAVWILRGSRLLFTDLLATQTAMEIIGGYKSLPFSSSLALGLLSMVCIVPVVLQVRPNTYPFKTPSRLGLYLVPLLIFYGIYSVGFEQFEYSWDESENSYVYSFFANAKLLSIPEPEGYSPEKAEELIMDADAQARFIQSDYNPQQAIRQAFPDYLPDAIVRPNIIVVMNESYADLEVYGDIQTDQEIFPVTNHLPNSLQGDVFTEVFGGGTADSEYSFLTGNSTLLLPTNARPYQLFVDQDTPNIVSQLRERGYEAVAIHPGWASAWNRSVVYHDFDFNAFYDITYFEDTPYRRIEALHTDEAVNALTEQLYQEKGEAPFFAFDVTIQNHGGYNLGNENLDLITSKDDLPAEVIEYLSLVRASDLAFGQLVEYFNHQDEPTIICMFGDHQPNLVSRYVENRVGKDKEDFSLKESQRLQATPYVIWANYPLPTKPVGSVSINYLSTILLECAGIESSPYQNYLASLHDKYLVVDRKGVVDKDGKYYAFDDENLDEEKKDEINQLKQVLYYTIIDTKHRDESLYKAPTRK